MTGREDRYDLAGALHQLCSPDLSLGQAVPLQMAASTSAPIASAWPEVQFTRRRSLLRAITTGKVPTQGAGFVFQPGLLRPPGGTPGRWPSSTIALSWQGRQRTAGLADYALAHDKAEMSRARGARVAAVIVAQQLGGPMAPLSAHVENILTDAVALIANGDPAQDAATLARLLQANDAAKLVVLSRVPYGPLTRLARRAGVAILPLDATNPWAVITLAAALHAPAQEEIAILARLAGRTVWSADGVALPDVDPPLFAAAHTIVASRYSDPATGKPITCEAFLDRLIEWRRLSRRIPAIACFVGISFWKRRRMAQFAGGPIRFASTASRAVALATAEGGGIAVWPSRAPKGLDEAAAAARVPVFRVEDGFIRSRGLGADFIPPASVIIDKTGIYYDARQPSDLEGLLAEQDFTPDLLAQARSLMDLLIARRITKYNLGGAREAIDFPAGRRRVLVPGQVANDLSVKAGGAGVAPGLPLLAEVRRRNPDAFIVYKPHPDVEAGHRPGAVPDGELRQVADLIVRDVDMASLIDAVEEVHTVTSLTGFEALLRNRQVVTYGRPFYAGWGLTTDLYPPPRRGRVLRLEELVAATLILYPHYIDPLTGLPCGPEHLIEQMDQAGSWRTGLLVGLRRGQGVFRRTWSRGLSRRTAKVA